MIPREVVHRYEHETTDQARFLNIHAPGMGFAEYLFGERAPEDADNIFDPPETRGARRARRPRSPSPTRARRSPTGPSGRSASSPTCPSSVSPGRATSPGEEGPGPHIHKEHLDAFFILTGELNFGLGPEVERVTARPGTFVLAPPDVIHTFRNDGPADATWLNFHAPSKGFASFLRDPDFVWDSFDAPADGGRPAERGDRGSHSPPHRAHNM